MKYEDYLVHFNPNHDKLGRFAKSHFGIGRKLDKPGTKTYNKMIDQMHEGIRKDKAREQILGPEATAPKEKKGLTEEQKRALKIATIGAVAAVGLVGGVAIAHRLHATEKIKGLLGSGVTDKNAFKDVMTEALNDETEILKAGTLIHRMEGVAGRDISKENGITYAAYKPKDRAVYMNLLADWAGTGKRYDATYEAVKDLKIPTEKKARQIFDALWNENPEYRKALSETLIAEAKKQNPLLAAYRPERVEQIFREALGKGAGNDNFYAGIYAMVKRGKDSDILTDAFKKAGYDAIHDYHDIFDKLTDSPVILLDPKSTVIKTGEERVTKAVKAKVLKGLLSEGVTALPTELKGLGYKHLTNKDGKVDVRKLLANVMIGAI